VDDISVIDDGKAKTDDHHQRGEGILTLPIYNWPTRGASSPIEAIGGAIDF
jgi:hypothetical protein